jgi:plastocyanin
VQIARKQVLRAGSLLAACVAAVALLGAPAATAREHAAKPKEVSINDFYFGPSSLTINKNQKVKWVWSELNTYPHDVHLKSGPKGVSKTLYSTKTTAVTGATFTRKFTTPGVYKFICTIHPTQMKLTVVVKK